MSKTLPGLIFALLVIVLVLVACVPQATPTPTSAPVTDVPTIVTEPPTEAPTPTLIPAPLSGPKSGSLLKWIDTSLLAFVPAGEFSMGSAISTYAAHAVALDAYWIQQTEVTNGMYAQCVAAGACTPPTQELGAPVYTNQEYSSHPVVGVSWDQASAYCTWTGGRLPSEAEWEKAARGSGDNVFPWGYSEPNCDLVNFAGCVRHTTSVTSYEAGRSPYGLYNMAGNVFEWVGDWYSETYYSESPAVNPTGPETGEFRVVRGSSFESEVGDGLEAVIRHWMAPGRTAADVGFRCVVPQPQPYAPFCQQTAHVPGVGGLPQGTCQLPDLQVRGQYCAGGDGFVTMNLSEGASYQINREDYQCTEAVVDGQRLLTCKGPRTIESSVEVTACNDACSGAPDQTGMTAACEPGYTLDAPTGMCIYSPIPVAASETGCPAGYKLIDRGGTGICALAPGVDGKCSTGLYLDELYGACVPPAGTADIPYGISNPELAQQSYAGCASGYQYEPSFQCCQAASSAAYPACAPGTSYKVESKACVPTDVRVSGQGCVTAQATTIKCSEPVDICSKITKEVTCIANGRYCIWDDKRDVCSLRK